MRALMSRDAFYEESYAENLASRRVGEKPSGMIPLTKKNATFEEIQPKRRELSRSSSLTIHFAAHR